jgi:hypothetical protein
MTATGHSKSKGLEIWGKHALPGDGESLDVLDSQSKARKNYESIV